MNEGKCPMCGARFEKRHGSQVYCSDKCRYNFNNDKRREYHREYGRRYYAEHKELLRRRRARGEEL